MVATIIIINIIIITITTNIIIVVDIVEAVGWNSHSKEDKI